MARDNYQSRLLRRQAWRTGNESDGTQALNSTNDEISEASVDGVTRTTGAAWTPAMTLAGASFVEDSNNARHQWEGHTTNFAPDGQPATHSIYVKPLLGKRAFFFSAYLSMAQTWFDLGTGKSSDAQSYNSAQVIGARAEPARFGWWKFIVWYVPNGGTSYWQAQLSNETNAAASTVTGNNLTYQGDGVSGLYLWRPKASTGAYV